MADRSPTAHEISALIRRAIVDKNVVVADEHGQIREMCPHMMGKTNDHAHIPLSVRWRKQNWFATPWITGQLARFRLGTNSLTSGTQKKNGTASNNSEVQACGDEIELKVNLT